VELGHQRRAEFFADDEALDRALAIDAALVGEQGIELLQGLKRDRVDGPDLLAAALTARRALDVGKLEELPPRMREASSLADRPRYRFKA
jgi:hypothetical protein